MGRYGSGYQQRIICCSGVPVLILYVYLICCPQIPYQQAYNIHHNRQFQLTSKSMEKRYVNKFPVNNLTHKSYD